MSDTEEQDTSAAPEAADQDPQINPLTDEQIWNDLNAEGTADQAASDDDEIESESDPSKSDGDVSADNQSADNEPDRSEEVDTSAAAKGDENSSSPKDRLKSLEDQNKRLENKFRSEQGRSKAQQRKVQQHLKEIDRLNSRLAKYESQSDGEEDDLDAIASEYPEVTGPLVDKVKDLQSRANDQREDDASRRDMAQTELDEMQRTEESVLLAEHDDGFEVIAQNREVFKDWIEDQPKIVRDAFAANRDRLVDGVGAAFVVSKFKAAIAEAEQQQNPSPEPENEPQTQHIASRRNLQKSGAQNRKSASRAPAAVDQPPTGASDQDYWNYWDRQDQKRSGR